MSYENDQSLHWKTGFSGWNRRFDVLPDFSAKKKLLTFVRKYSILCRERSACLSVWCIQIEKWAFFIT